MCGIAGLIQRDRKPIGAELVAMADALAHRGPDQQGTWTFSHSTHTVGLAHRRLSIRDLSEAGRQPMASASQHTVVVYNGEIYNDAVIAKRLASAHGISLRTKCDTEVIVEALECEGANAIRSFNGIFAFAAYDTRRGTLLLARDPIGVKPLYLWRDPNERTLAFASEVKAFLPLDSFSRKIDLRSLASLLAQGYVGPSRSLMQDVVSVLPGQVLEIGSDGRVSELFRMAAPGTKSKPQRTETLDSAAAWLKPKFEDAVSRQRAADVPLAVWQSGGIDSSLVNAACRPPRPRPLTVSSQHEDFDELPDAQRVAQTLGQEIEAVSLRDGEQSADKTFADLVWHMDGELADSSALAVKHLSAATKPYATVVLSGDGADEYFGGYATYAATELAARFGAFAPQRLTQTLAQWCLSQAASGNQRYPKIEWAGRFFQGLPQAELAHAEWRRYAMPWQLRELWVDAELAAVADPLADYRQAIADARSEAPGAKPAQWGQTSDIAYYLPGDMLMKVDRMSMAHGLEVRVPFLDLEFLAAADELSPTLRLPAGRETKPLLRRMLERYGFPASITQRKKTGFNVALAKELRTTFKPVLTTLLLDGDFVEPMLRADRVCRLCRDHLDGTANHAYLLWTLMTFAQWRKHLGQ